MAAPHSIPSHHSTTAIHENSKYLNPGIRNCDLRYVHSLTTAFNEVFVLLGCYTALNGN